MKASFLPQTVNFPKEYYKAPTMITTPKHVKTNIDADNNAITEWVKVRMTLDHAQKIDFFLFYDF